MQRATAVLLVLALAPAAQAVTWTLDPNHTSVQFSVRHMMVSTVRGGFDKVTGTVEEDPADLGKSKVEATIDAASVDTRVAKRDDHLRSPDFLDVAHHPTITFRSKRAEKAGAGRWRLVGDLTLHGVTKEVVLDVEGPTATVKDPMGSLRAGVHATTTIDRKDFGLVWNRALDGGGVVVGDEVAIAIDAEATRPAN
ncbi:MAG TPA: YceI family protein [Candidatus Binatia bacterium]|nr:YceI family protein [Candidatus Binatia bacterium]